MHEIMKLEICISFHIAKYKVVLILGHPCVQAKHLSCLAPLPASHLEPDNPSGMGTSP